MSADNGIYIAKFPTCWRVAYASAIENIEYFPAGSEERINELKNYFEKSPVLKSEQQALNYARELIEEHEFLEYGMVILQGEWDEFDISVTRKHIPVITTTTNSPPVAVLYSIRNLKSTERQLWLGDKRIGNIQGKNLEAIEEIVRLANLAVRSLMGIEFKVTD